MVAANPSQPRLERIRPSQKIRNNLWTLAIHVTLLFLVITSFYPLIFTLIASLKNNTQFYYNFWLPYAPFHWENFGIAWKQLQLGIFNSLWLCLASVVGVVIMSCLSGWAFARYQWPGKQVLYYMIMVLMMVPWFLTLIPQYWLVRNTFHLAGNINGVLLPYLANQAVPIFLMRSFFENLPPEIFDSAKVDGATELQCLFRIALPLCTPIIATVVMMHIVSVWNDFFWPMVASNSVREVYTAIVRMYWVGQSSGLTPDYGPLTAGYLILSLPMILMFLGGMRYYVAGLTTGAIKA